MAAIEGLPAQREEEILRERIVAGRCVLFIGSGASTTSPSRAELAQQLTSYQGWNPPTGLSFPWAAQCYELRYGRSSLVSYIKGEIERVKEPPASYRTIAALPFRLILTTRYDTLLEKALDEAGVAYQTVLGTDDSKRCRLGGLRIVKLYGCITEPDSLIITEEDQFALFDRWPDFLDTLGITLPDRTLLFIECDMMDAEFRRMYRDLAPRLSRAEQSAYIIQRDVPEPLAHYWATKGLSVVEADAGELLKSAVACIEAREAKRALPRPADEPLELEVAPWTERGCFRDVNEDYFQVWMPSDPRESQRGNLFLVADGMGGRNAGEIASRLAADIIGEEYYADVYTNTQEDVSISLARAVEAANRAVYQQAHENPAQMGMGTTVVATVVRGQELHAANVGDSRAYLIHGEMIDQITLDHSFVAEEVRAGKMTPHLARDHPQRNLLTRVLGVEHQVDVDIFQRGLEKGDIIVLCSDGLTEYVREYEIKEAVHRYPPTLAVRRLAKLANDRGGWITSLSSPSRLTEE